MTDTKTEKKSKSIIAGLIDRSGSMISIKEDTEGGLKSFIKEQQKDSKEHDIKMSLSEFDNRYDEVYGLTDINEVPEYVLQPRSMTALLDALGFMLSELKETVTRENPDKVIVMVFTDGLENSSKEYSLPDIKKQIEDLQEKEGWEFIFLGANIDAVSVGTDLGFKANSSMTYGTNKAGVTSTYEAVSTYTRNIRMGAEAAFTDEDRKRAMGE